MHCMLDMDGVLVNFVEGAMKTHGKWIRRGQVKWDFHVQLGIPDKKFWDPFGYDFWSNLEWHEEGHKLLDELTKLFGLENIVILTSPCATQGCADGKIAWIKKNIPQFKRRFLIGSVKHMCASPKHILIDDHDLNVEKFEQHGGHTELVPRSWNKREHLTVNNTYCVDKFMELVQNKVTLCSIA